MESDEARGEMLRAVSFRIQDEVEKQAGRRIYSRSQIDGTSDKARGNGHLQNTMAFKIEPVKRRNNGNGTSDPNA